MALLEKLTFMSSLFAVKGTRVTGWGGGGSEEYPRAYRMDEGM